MVTARNYGVSFVLAVFVHALVASMLWMNWTPIEEELVAGAAEHREGRTDRDGRAEAEGDAEARADGAAGGNEKARAEAGTETRAEARAETGTQTEPGTGETDTPKPDVAKEVAQTRGAEKKKRLDSLADASFSDSLASETEVLSEDKNEQAAQTYAQGIYQLIVTNWSRPPSARNGMQTKLIVELVPTGDVVNVTIASSSGNEAFDRSAEQAVRKVGKFDVPKDPELFEKYFRRFPVLFNPEDLLR